MVQLLLEVPNPGGRGRRMVASAAGSETPADVHAHARAGPEGPDYLAVEWPTMQRLESQAVRDDADRLMIIGIDTSGLSPAERDRIRDALRELRPEIAQVLGAIDWKTAAGETVIESAALAELLRRPAFSCLPLLAEVAGRREPGTTATGGPSSGPIPRLLALTGSALFLITAMVWWRGCGTQPPGQSPKPDQRLKQAAASMNCSEQELSSWINSAQGKQAEAPLDDLVLEVLSKRTGISLFFVIDQSPDEYSQLRDFIESLNPLTPLECIGVRVALDEAHTHLVDLRESAKAAARCGAWAKKLESTSDRNRDPLPSEQVAFIKSLVAFGAEDISSIGPESATVTPFFQQKDHRRFNDFATFFTQDRQAPIRNLTPRIAYTSGKTWEALLEVVKTMPLQDPERKRLVAIGDTASTRAECRELLNVIEHFIGMCEALGKLPRAGREP